MNLPETVDFVRSLAAMVRVRGLDPKGLKMRNHAFYQSNLRFTAVCRTGRTTLSASGVLLPDAFYDANVASRISGGDGQRLALILTVASVVEPFVSVQRRESSYQGVPELIPGAHIEVMLDDKLEFEMSTVKVVDGDSPWITAKLLRLVDVPASSSVLESLLKASSGSPHHGWEMGWSLASRDDAPQHYGESRNSSETKESRNPTYMGWSATRIAILGVPLNLKNLPSVPSSPSTKRGDFLLAVGSPFGIISPVHFLNSISAGSISNHYSHFSLGTSLLMADIRCLPGMEGGPVFDKYGRFIGVLIRPLRQKSTGAEIQLVIPWEAIASACIDLLLKGPEIADKEVTINTGKLNAVGEVPSSNKYEPLDSDSPSPLPVEKAMSSVCLITIDEGTWASGVLLNEQGLILTNAHLLEPWRFGKTNVTGGGYQTISYVVPLRQEFLRPQSTREELYEKNKNRFLSSQASMDSSTMNWTKGYASSLSYKGHQAIRIRLNRVDPWIWCDAKVVYISTGPLDVALLQLDCIPDRLCPISVDLSCPSLGSKAYVIGHALFGPRCGLPPSVCSGVVSKVVNAKAPSYCKSLHGMVSPIPAMLETTASVNPGGSGGAIVNSEGQMIALVTSNTRYGGRTVIPHLNFSIPCAVLTPIFEFAKDMRDTTILKQLDQPNDDLTSVWSLVPLPSTKPKPEPSIPLQESLHKPGKGSKFAKFMAERDTVWRRPSSNEVSKSSSNELLRSKL
ncbi:Glyoxysomal processing protease, glyoxysomal [Linum grandiflorum]